MPIGAQLNGIRLLVRLLKQLKIKCSLNIPLQTPLCKRVSSQIHINIFARVLRQQISNFQIACEVEMKFNRKMGPKHAYTICTFCMQYATHPPAHLFHTYTIRQAIFFFYLKASVLVSCVKLIYSCLMYTYMCFERSFKLVSVVHYTSSSRSRSPSRIKKPLYINIVDASPYTRIKYNNHLGAHFTQHFSEEYVRRPCWTPTGHI